MSVVEMEELIEQTYDALSVFSRSVWSVSLVPGSTADHEANGALGKSVANCCVAAALRMASLSTDREGLEEEGAGDGEEGISVLPEFDLVCSALGVPGGVEKEPDPVPEERSAGLEGEGESFPRPAMRSLMLACFDAEVKEARLLGVPAAFARAGGSCLAPESGVEGAPGTCEALLPELPYDELPKDEFSNEEVPKLFPEEFREPAEVESSSVGGGAGEVEIGGGGVLDIVGTGMEGVGNVGGTAGTVSEGGMEVPLLERTRPAPGGVPGSIVDGIVEPEP